MADNKINKGDIVRFMNAVGGGIVTRVDAGRGMIWVEDQDGFEVPALMRECVAVPRVNEKTNFPMKDFSSKTTTMGAVEIPAVQERIEKPVPVEIVETAGGDKLQAFLAIIPNDIKNIQTCTYDCVLINDSNYFLFYNIIIGEKDNRRSVSQGILEPNIQEDIVVIAKNDLNDWEDLRIQAVPFKKGKKYEPQQAIDKNVQIAPLKLYKLHTFGTNEYFDYQAWLIDLTEAPEKPMPEIKPEDIKRALFEKEQSEKPKLQPRTKVQLNPDVIEVDLHINELTDNTAGMNNANMLEMQLDKFHAVIAENIKKRGQKIVFIHGKGEGVLRNEIMKLLKTRYKTFYFQDASFREYGFGATMIVIR